MVTMAHQTSGIDSVLVEGQWRVPCIPVVVDSGRVLYLERDTLWIAYPHTCAPANGLEVGALIVASFVLGFFIAGLRRWLGIESK